MDEYEEAVQSQVDRLNELAMEIAIGAVRVTYWSEGFDMAGYDVVEVRYERA